MTSRGSQEIPSLLERLAATPDRVEVLVRDSDDMVLDADAEGEWSARTVLAHLRDDEFMVMRLRLERMLVEHEPELAPFDEKAWAASRNTGRDSCDELLSDFRTQREASVAIVKTLTTDDWRRIGLQPEYGSFDIHWWLEHCLDHDNNHLNQIESALAQNS